MTFALCRTWTFSGTFPTKAWVERIVILGYSMEPDRVMISLGRCSRHTPHSEMGPVSLISAEYVVTSVCMWVQSSNTVLQYVLRLLCLSKVSESC